MMLPSNFVIEEVRKEASTLFRGEHRENRRQYWNNAKPQVSAIDYISQTILQSSHLRLIFYLDTLYYLTSQHL